MSPLNSLCTESTFNCKISASWPYLGHDFFKKKIDFMESLIPASVWIHNLLPYSDVFSLITEIFATPAVDIPFLNITNTHNTVKINTSVFPKERLSLVFKNLI